MRYKFRHASLKSLRRPTCIELISNMSVMIMAN